MTDTIIYNGKTYDATHGGPFDRGGADCYYRRPAKPHYYPDGTSYGKPVEEGQMTPKQIADYMAGYEQAEGFDKKEW
jgi:hypothetical protein